ncbi:hypothetical protein K440DRAFT_625575 [Wilcoxina mikolae CBS 423.85]|nr:hypothetical protein K440DRAFT_625575 [Wilcoxina mikolae CBS 423.85]
MIRSRKEKQHREKGEQKTPDQQQTRHKSFRPSPTHPNLLFPNPNPIHQEVTDRKPIGETRIPHNRTKTSETNRDNKGNQNWSHDY